MKRNKPEIHFWGNCLSYLFQRVPEVSTPSADLDEALTFHGLTRPKMSAEMIRWVDSVRLESPELHRTILYDPPHIKSRMGIRKWDFAFSTGITTDYPVRRGWNDFMAVREFVQNALDAEERIFGYELIEVGLWVDDLGLHISDRGLGITYEAFRLGGSDKKCFERGFFGEGLKVGLAHFASKGFPVYVFNRKGQVFKAFVSPGTTLVLMAIGRARPVSGTEVVVYGLPEKSPEWADVAYVRRIIFKEWLKQEPKLYILTTNWWLTDACAFKKRPNFIISHLDKNVNVDFLWSRDISVNKISAITGYPSIFGYNLWWVELEPNRITVSSVPELGRQVVKAFDGKAVRELLDRVVGNSTAIATSLAEWGKVKQVFETINVDWWDASDDAKNEAAAWVKEKGYGYTDNERAVDWALYLGVKPLVVPSNFKYLFSKAQTLEDVIMVKGLNRITTAEENAVNIESLSLVERCRLRAAQIILENVHITIWGRENPAPQLIATEKMDAAGTVSEEKIYVLRGSLYSTEAAVETVLHEYAHYYGRLTYGEARDVSEAFERALGYVASQVAFIPEQARLAFHRARNGVWGAKNVEWREGRYRSLLSLSERFGEALKNGVKQLGIQDPRITVQALEIDYDVPLIITVHFSSWELKDIERGVWFPIRPANYDKRLYAEDIQAWELPYARLDLYKAVIEKFLKGEEKRWEAEPERAHVMLLFNPEKDDYEVWKVIPPRRT